ncbi:MAG: division/cell wall cluster transcriptional repressor MraZ [Leptospirillum sp.]|jgi:MraZ protein
MENIFYGIFVCGEKLVDIFFLRSIMGSSGGKWGIVVSLFRGRYQHALDDKGRVAIPGRYRDVLDETGGDSTLIVTAEPDECLSVYPLAVWAELEKKIMNLPQMNPDLKTYLRFVVGFATECVPDRQGRILLPAPLREFAHLERDIWFVGVLDKFEIWNGDRLMEVTGKDRIQSVSQSLTGLF